MALDNVALVVRWSLDIGAERVKLCFLFLSIFLPQGKNRKTRGGTGKRGAYLCGHARRDCRGGGLPLEACIFPLFSSW